MIDMVDHSRDKRSEGEEGSEMKSCVDCGATKTPLWRTGPAGPKTLCNACGIKSRKKRGSAALLGVKSSSEEKKAKKLSTNTNVTSSNSSSDNNDDKQSNRSRNSSNNSTKLSQSLKKKLVPLGQVVFQRSIAERLRRRLGEEEQAAMLLLAISGGCVY